MKHKLLLVGRNRRLINDFFMQMDFFFECMSSSGIFSDMKIHYQYFKPDALVYCMHSENRDDMVSVINFAENTVRRDGVPFIVISDNADYDFLCKLPNGKPDLKISASEAVSIIQEEITSHIVRLKNAEMERANQLEEARASMSDKVDLLARVEEQFANLDSGKPVEIPPVDTKMPMLGRPRILIVDDSTIIHKTIKSYLEDEYDISSAISGAAALRFLKAKEVNLILLDYEMPEMDGIEVLKQLRSDPATKDIPVVFLTGINDATKIQKALVMKPDGYLLKPIDKEPLLEKIKDLIG